MLPYTLLRTTLLLSLTSLRPLTRGAHTMAAHSYTLDRAHFTPDLYTRVRTLWFAGLPPNASAAPPSTMKKWFGFGLSQAEKTAFDEECRAAFAPALEALGPDKVSLPERKGGWEEGEGEIAKPLLREVEVAGSEREKAETLLSLVLLLDQMPRNLYRTRDTLPLVYEHYDRLALALVRGAMDLSPCPMLYAEFMQRPVWGGWFLLPLTHSEGLEAHAMREVFVETMDSAVREAEDQEGVGYLEQVRKAEREHVEVLERFGRYPQRNQALGRRSTEEERVWLREGGGFGVVQDEEEEERRRDEL